MPRTIPACFLSRAPCRARWSVLALVLLASAAQAAPRCEASSGERLLPVVELYTSEGCSSCPPADQWLSALKDQPVLAQAFHVPYWDYIGWVDRFASPAFTARQKEVAAANALDGIYTPQVVRNGRDWPDWRRGSTWGSAPAQAGIAVQSDDASRFVARVTPVVPNQSWTAYWTVTENGYSSRVRAGENSGAFLQHDFVVRQYLSAGNFQGAQTLQFAAIPAVAEHPRHINLVVADAQTRVPLQAISLQCH